MVLSPPKDTAVCEATTERRERASPGASPGISSRNHPWNDQQTARLIDLWNEAKLSAAGIARCLCLTRNAVLGKVWRMRLPPHPQPPAKKRPPRVRPPKVWTPPPPPPPIVEDPTPPDFLGLELYQLTSQQCHYPRGERAPYRYCGQPVQENSSYCPYCHRLSYFPRTPARRHKPIQAPWVSYRGRYG